MGDSASGEGQSSVEAATSPTNIVEVQGLYSHLKQLGQQSLMIRRSKVLKALVALSGRNAASYARLRGAYPSA